MIHTRSWLEDVTREINTTFFKARPYRIAYHDGDTIGAIAFPDIRKVSLATTKRCSIYRRTNSTPSPRMSWRISQRTESS